MSSHFPGGSPLARLASTTCPHARGPPHGEIHIEPPVAADAVTPDRPDLSDASTSPSVSESLRLLTEDELTSLSDLGRRWSDAFDNGLPELPVEPSLERSGHTPSPSRFGRFTPISMFRVESPREVLASEQARDEQSAAGRRSHRLHRIVLGPPLASSAVVHERMRKAVASPVLSGDLLSSVAYGPAAMITVLLLAGTGALGLELPLGLGLAALMIIVGVSYRQTIRAYPSGAG